MAANTQNLTEEQRTLLLLHDNALPLLGEFSRFANNVHRAFTDDHWQMIRGQWTTLCEGRNELANHMTLQSKRILSAARAERGLSPKVSFIGLTTTSMHAMVCLLVDEIVVRVISACGMDATIDETGQLVGDYASEHITQDNLVEVKRQLKDFPDADSAAWPDFVDEFEIEYFAAEQMLFPDGISASLKVRPAENNGVQDTDLDTKAIAVFLKHRDWTKKRIAKHLGCHEKSLAPKRCPTLDSVMKAFRTANQPPKGSKARDGSLEAWDDTQDEG